MKKAFGSHGSYKHIWALWGLAGEHDTDVEQTHIGHTLDNHRIISELNAWMNEQKPDERSEQMNTV